ncbi:MFS transporter [Actinocrinis puniceicyclus]|uniref:MFS transporter n=1 Tax=Actinocrinis puniceicyclus TaxID=977794 RepID=A0A8J7WM15_9ACTN|nr:MFS transporter [Actinocrinis puniceicyclus]MBS2962249.1 MFS transporter [Actinocrinis puniceicyclus]
MSDHNRSSVAASYWAFVLVGVGAGAGGVLLPAQIADYGVDRTRIGITFFVFSAGFMLAGSTVGALMHRIGTRNALATGTAVFVLSDLYVATHPTFAGLVIVQLLLGYGGGVVESVLNTHLARLPRSAQRVNRLHAFFGVGALLGPLLATWMLRSWSWPSVYLVIALLNVPLLVGVLLVFPSAVRPGGGPAVAVAPGPGVQPPTAAASASAADPAQHGRGLLAAALRERAVLLGALFLAVYVGLEVSIGNWGFSFLVDGRTQSPLIAGYALSGYWLGLTAGRFVISPVASRAGLSDVAVSFGCLAGILAACVLVWAASAAVAAAAGFALLGFFLGPLFPTTMAITPRLAEPRLVPTAIGFINGVSVVGGSALPWLAGTIAQAAGIMTLIPFCIALTVLLLLIWWRLARHAPAPREASSAGLDYA